MSTQRRRQKATSANLPVSIAVVEQIGLTVRTIAICGVICLIFYFLRDIFSSIAGKETSANVALSFLANVQVEVALAWSFGIAGILYGASQKQLRRNYIAKFHADNANLERRLDSRRSSTQLTAHGDTNPEDTR